VRISYVSTTGEVFCNTDGPGHDKLAMLEELYLAPDKVIFCDINIFRLSVISCGYIVFYGCTIFLVTYMSTRLGFCHTGSLCCV